MSSRSRPQQEPGLFDDLPLHPATEPAKSRAAGATPGAKTVSPPPVAKQPEPLLLFDDDILEAPEDLPKPAAQGSSVPFKTYLTAGLLDLAAMLLVIAVLWIGLRWLDVDLDMVGRALVLIFLVPFSFLYQIFPLAFWGRTPGMAKAGLVARNRDGQTLSFSQATQRWLASVLTVAGAGLPLLLAATTGQSLADRLSDSQTLSAR